MARKNSLHITNDRRLAKDHDASIGFVPEYMERANTSTYPCVRPSCGQACEGAALFCPSCLARAR